MSIGNFGFFRGKANGAGEDEDRGESCRGRESAGAKRRPMD